MSREDQTLITVSVGGTNLGVFDKLEGGEIDSEETKYRPGGMQEQLSLGGYRNVGNITVSRLYDVYRDHTLMPTLIAGVGKALVSVSRQPLDIDGNPFGAPITYTGKLKALTPNDLDSESSDALIYELEVSTDSAVHA